MSAGRIRYLGAGEKGPKTPAFRLLFAGGAQLVLTEGGPKKRARVGLYRPDAIAGELDHLGPEAAEIEDDELAELLRREGRRLHPFLRDQRALAGIGRAWSNEILHRARLSPYALSTELTDGEVERLGETIRETLAQGLELRLRGASDKQAYRIHNRLGEPCPACGTPIARVDFEEHTIYYCPECQTGGRVLKDRRLSRLLR
jgi:formamidopyrimidine-DNA glycosylase